MTRDDIEHFAQVCESLKAQCKAQEDGFRVDRDFDGFIGRMLWAIHASPNNPLFDENRFRAACNGEGGLRVFDE
jgi:hypothetical protein